MQKLPRIRLLKPFIEAKTISKEKNIGSIPSKQLLRLLDRQEPLSSNEAFSAYERLSKQLELSHYHSILTRIDSKSQFTTIFKGIKENGIEPDSFVYSLYFKFLSGKQIMILHKHMVHNNLHSNKSIQSLVEQVVKDKTVLSNLPSIWEDCKNSKLRLTIDTLLSFLNGFTLLNHKDSSETIHRILIAKRNQIKVKDPYFQFNVEVYHGLLKAHDMFSNARATIRLFQETLQVYPDSLSKAMALIYLKALTKMDYHHDILQFSIILNKNSLLDNQICRVLFESFAKTNNVKQLLKWQNIVKNSIESNQELDFNALKPLIKSFVSLDYLDQSFSLFQYYAQQRKLAITMHNVSLDLPFTAFEMAELFVKNDSILKRFRDWNLDSPSRKDAALIVGHLAKRKDERLVGMMKQILHKDVLYLYWARYLASKKSQLSFRRDKLQEKLDNPKIKARSEFKKEISKIERALKRTPLKVGNQGPFAVVYNAMEQAWRQSTIQGDVLGLDKIREELEAWETQSVLQSPIGEQLLIMHNTPRSSVDSDEILLNHVQEEYEDAEKITSTDFETDSAEYNPLEFQA